MQRTVLIGASILALTLGLAAAQAEPLQTETIFQAQTGVLGDGSPVGANVPLSERPQQPAPRSYRRRPRRRRRTLIRKKAAPAPIPGLGAPATGASPSTTGAPTTGAPSTGAPGSSDDLGLPPPSASPAPAAPAGGVSPGGGAGSNPSTDNGM